MCFKMANPCILLLSAILLMGCIFNVSLQTNEESPGARANIQREEGYEHVSDHDYKRITPCIQNLTIMELCMRCAKVTKSTIVYPMCCSNEDNVYNWCTEYVYYGIRS